MWLANQNAPMLLLVPLNLYSCWRTSVKTRVSKPFLVSQENRSDLMKDFQTSFTKTWDNFFCFYILDCAKPEIKKQIKELSGVGSLTNFELIRMA